jgi:hypothetical protein
MENVRSSSETDACSLGNVTNRAVQELRFHQEGKDEAKTRRSHASRGIERSSQFASLYVGDIVPAKIEVAVADLVHEIDTVEKEHSSHLGRDVRRDEDQWRCRARSHASDEVAHDGER